MKRLTSAVLLLAALAAPARAGVLKVLQDFESAGKPLPTGQAAITTGIASETAFGQACFRVTVAQDFNWRWRGWSGQQDVPLDSLRLAVLSGPYLPPETDAIRMKVRVASGRAILAVGGPVSQMGNSDVYCDPKLVDAKDGGEWRTLDLSLNQRVVRNFRRPNFSGDLPVIYYTRWAQEPVYLYLLALPEPLRPAEETVLFIDQIELLARGEGRPFPVFEPATVKTVGQIATFDSDADRTNVFSVAHGYSYLKSFEAIYRRSVTGETGRLPEALRGASPFVREEGLPYPAPRFSRTEGRQGTGALRAECLWAEEGPIVAFKTRGHAGANALSFTLKPDLPATAGGAYGCELGGRRANAIDFVVFVAPAGAAFPWSDIEPTAELTQALRASSYKGPGGRFDYLLTTDRKGAGVRVPDIRQAGAFGFYLARRYVPAGEWSTVIVPFNDFICVYGQGACKELQAGQRPLRPEIIAAVGLLVPYGAGHGAFSVDEVASVQVPGAPADLRSFWQVPGVAGVRLLPLPGNRQYGTWTMMTLGEDLPPFLKAGAGVP